MPRVGFEPTISAGLRPKTYALDRAATGIGRCHMSDFRELLRSKRDLRSSRMFSGVEWWYVTDVAGRPIGLISNIKQFKKNSSWIA